MALAAGTRLGPYEVVGSLGAGGMGEVYRARDTSLGREVAIKVLPDAFARDPERLARFEREARTLASLNHPNIAIIHGLERSGGVPALVMELVEGPTLAERIARGPIPVDEALPIARQIAEALEAAHDQGIIHRDLKPANVKVRPDSSVKVLDFGLAKALEPAAAGMDVTASPTITSPALMTGVGVLLGTAAYMSPEQAKGRPADKRSDVWAFGVVLYEMLTARQPFAGEDVTDTIAAVVRAEPDWDRLPPDTPPAVRRVLKRCLEKKPRERLPHIGAARLDINEALVAAPEAILARAAGSRSLSTVWLAWSVAFVSMVALVAVVAFPRAFDFRGSSPIENVYRSTISPLTSSSGDSWSHLALSPDGRYLAFVAPDAGGRVMLWVRPLDGVEAQPLAGTQGAAAPFWSPDSRLLAFVADGKLKRIEAAGGPVVVLCDAEVGRPGAWNQDEVILFTSGRSSPLFRVSAAGGTPSPATIIDSTAGSLVHAFPSFLPDGRHFLFLSQTVNGSDRGLEVGSLDSTDRKRLIEGVSNAAFTDGYLLFEREGTLTAQTFDTTRLELTGDAVPVVTGVDELAPSLAGGASFAVSRTGVLVYRTPSPESSQLTWFNRSGQQTGVLADRGDYGNVWLSPDGSHVGVESGGALAGATLLVFEARRGVSTRLTSDPSDTTFPVWSPDSTRLVFTSRRKGNLDLYERSASGAESEAPLWADDLDKFPTSWSPDGRFILYTAVSSDTDSDVWILPLTDDRLPAGSGRVENLAARKPYPLVQTRFAERSGQFSPDGRWIAYQSHESGQAEVFVTRFPGTGATIRVSPGGGSNPQWRGDGRELYFHTPDGTMMAAAVVSDAVRFEVGLTRALFRVPLIRQSSFPWDVSADGQRFLVNVPADQNRQASMTLVVNWPGLLPRR